MKTIIDFFNDITFAEKHFLWLLLIIPIYTGWYVFKLYKKQASLHVSSLRNLETARKSVRPYLRHSILLFRLITIALLIIILARPQSNRSWKDVKTQGINIIIALDISGSMLAQDLKPDRIEASKKVAMDFIDSRPADRIGLVIFSRESFPLCPLTTDHNVVKNFFSGVHVGMLQDGTAIGMGLSTAISRIDTTAKSNVIILLTDGVNNAGSVDPVTAAEAAKLFNTRVYTVGLGTRGKALAPVAKDAFGKLYYDYVDVDIDEDMLQKVADITGGKYFRATDTDKLKQIYQEIDKLEKNITLEKNFSKRNELFLPFALAALISLMVEFLLKNTFFRSIT